MITPPSELVDNWLNEYYATPVPSHMAAGGATLYIAAAAARWGSDQELEACCEWLKTGPFGFSIAATAPNMTERLRADRRPKPPSLKEQALEALDSFEGFTGSLQEVDTIRRALEALDD